jgi:hypothetical protein
MLDRLTSKLSMNKWGNWGMLVLWALTMIGLPLTSFPGIIKITGSMVAPLSAIPLAVLLFIWFVPYILRRGAVPREGKPLLIFIGFAVGLAAYAFFLYTDNFKDKSLLGNTLRTLITVGVGVSFYFVTSSWHKDKLSLKRTLQFINIGGAGLLIWGLMQAITLKQTIPPINFILEKVGPFLATQPYLTETGRIPGLTWEPSWLAHQLNMLYLPLWLAATYTRNSVFPKLWNISVENVFLVLGLVVFYFSSPRIGAAAFMLMLLYLFVKVNVSVYRWIINRTAHLWSSLRRPELMKAAVGIILVFLFVGIYIGLGMAALNVASKNDARIALLVTSPLSQAEISEMGGLNESSLFFVGQRFAFLERTVYWMTGWHIFNDFPFLGVGLGNSGYFFVSHLPAIGYSSYEIRSILFLNDGLPNIKSFWYRLLAETGIVGFSIFLAFIFVLWLSARSSQKSNEGVVKTISLAGRLALLAFIFEGLSVDSFVLPYFWVITGLLSATGWIYRKGKIHN